MISKIVKSEFLQQKIGKDQYLLATCFSELLFWNSKPLCIQTVYLEE